MKKPLISLFYNDGIFIFKAFLTLKCPHDAYYKNCYTICDKMCNKECNAKYIKFNYLSNYIVVNNSKVFKASRIEYIMANGLLKFIGTAVLVSAMGVGLIQSCHENYDKSRPGVVYYLDGKPVIQRRFDTNEEFQEYLNSERGKQEAEYYKSLNRKD